MSVMAPEPASVLIAGAGPTGLTLAWALRRYGLAPDIIDPKLTIASDSKALALNHLSQYGIAILGGYGVLGGSGCRIRRLNVNHRAQRLAAVDFRYLPGLVRNIVTQPQSVTELELNELLVRSGGAVERGVELVDVEQRGDAAQVTLRDSSGQLKRRHYRYVVGCEGRHSVVRERLGAQLELTDYAAHMVLGDFELGDGSPRDQVYYHAFDQTLFVIVGAGFLRRGPFWRSRAQLCRGVADRLRRGSLFIAGDAAHLFVPLGGTGMNTGIGDALNLAWKLAYACLGCRDAELVLQSYEQERLPLIRQLAEATDYTMRLAGGRDLGLAAPILPTLANRDAFRSTFPLRYSGLGQRYAPSALIHECDGSGAVGKFWLSAPECFRASGQAADSQHWPLGFVLLADGPSHSSRARRELQAFEQSAKAPAVRVLFTEADNAQREHRLNQALGPGRMVLLRPDGVVALHCSTSRLTEVQGYLSSFGSPLKLAG
ncbi:MAG: monooxygenase, FAD-binding [Polyangiaceae bacterium]|nr:monooxygenase, FAD-binding [Polyangiaceae bacterium]